MRSPTASGLTLIEVIAGIALMGTLLSVVLVGGSKHLRQLKVAEHKRESVRLLDAFLTHWSANRFSVNRIPDAVHYSSLPASGQFGSHGVAEPTMASSSQYQVHLARTESSSLVNASRVRLTVSRPDSLGKRLTSAWAEVIIPDEP